MRPISVDFGAFGPYAGEEHIDFEKLASKGLFLICGETGSGKTTMLDAITFALYGMSSGNVRDDFEAMRCTNADFDTPTYVKLTFEVNSDIYIFERRLERKRKNLSKSYNMMKKDSDGVFRVLLENPKEKDLNKKATELIGLEYSQFKQVIILPQGQFEKLLVCPSDEKEKILSNIFGEDKWQIIAEKMYEEAFEKRGSLREKRDIITASLKEEQCDNMEQLSMLIESKQSLIDALDEDFKKADYDLEVQKLNEQLMLVRRFGDLDKAKDTLEKLKERKPDRDASEEQLKLAKKADNVRNLLDDEMKDGRDFAGRQKAYENSVKAWNLAIESLAKATEEIKEHQKGDADIEEKKRTRLGYEGKIDDYSNIDASQEEYDKAVIEFNKAETSLKESLAETEELTRKLNEINNAYTEAGKEYFLLNDRYIKGITGYLAEGLSEGEECPVCGSTHHPNKAKLAEDYVSKEDVDDKQAEMDRLKEKVNAAEASLRISKDSCDKHKTESDKCKESMLTAKAGLETKKAGLIEGIDNLAELTSKIDELDKAILAYSNKTEVLLSREKSAGEKCTEEKAKSETAGSEAEIAKKKYEDTCKALETELNKNGFASADEAKSVLISVAGMNDLQRQISEYDASCESAVKAVTELEKELSGKTKPDEALCREELDKAKKAIEDYTVKKTELNTEKNRLVAKEAVLKKDGDGIEELIREAESDWVFAKKLRGDSGTGLQRYVLGIMFSTVIEAANKMLELVHDGRYRLFRSDDKAAGTNKRGLELKVFDKYSTDPEGRFVTTLSGGEKFLVSLALSIGMSTVAQRGGVKIEALFIDEGFGSLDQDSIVDAMNVLNCIQEANSLVGIISHVQLLQERIPTKLVVSKSEGVSHISESIG